MLDFEFGYIIVFTAFEFVSTTRLMAPKLWWRLLLLFFFSFFFFCCISLLLSFFCRLSLCCCRVNNIVISNRRQHRWMSRLLLSLSFQSVVFSFYCRHSVFTEFRFTQFGCSILLFWIVICNSSIEHQFKLTLSCSSIERWIECKIDRKDERENADAFYVHVKLEICENSRRWKKKDKSVESIHCKVLNELVSKIEKDKMKLCRLNTKADSKLD